MYIGVSRALMLVHFDSKSVEHFDQMQFINISSTIK